MNNIFASDGQSLLDVALQELGTVDAVLELAHLNGLAITDALAPGQLLTVPASVLARPEVAAYFAARSQRINAGSPEPEPEPATAMLDHDSLDYDQRDYI